MLKNQGQRTLLQTTKSIRTTTLTQKSTTLNARRSIHASVTVPNKARRQVDQQRSNNVQQSIGGIFEPFLETQTTANKQYVSVFFFRINEPLGLNNVDVLILFLWGDL